MHHAEAMQLGFDEVDALTGALIGRPKSATFRTMDVVGLDTMGHVVNTMKEQLETDPWHALFTLPPWFIKLLEAGHLGQKTGQGIYRKQGTNIEVYDLHSGQYRLAEGRVSKEVQAIMAKPSAKERFQALRQAKDKQATFLLACFRETFHYASYHLESIADSVRAVDACMRWGFGWQQGPFETAEEMDLSEVIEDLGKAMAQQASLAAAPLPSWLAKHRRFIPKKVLFLPKRRLTTPLRVASVSATVF